MILLFFSGSGAPPVVFTGSGTLTATVQAGVTTAPGDRGTTRALVAAGATTAPGERGTTLAVMASGRTTAEVTDG